MDYSFKNYHLKNLQINLLGYHQAVNAATALTAFITYCESLNRTIDLDNLRSSLNKVNWFGRMQILHRNPLVIIDGAHNEEGIHILIENSKKMFPNRTIRFVVAILRDKKLDNMIAEICSYANEIYISKNHSERAADLEEQIDVAKKSNLPYFAFDDVKTAALSAYQKTDKNDILIITGSLYTIAEILAEKDKLFQ
jgi:dihydrofolate synthase/folylpolyglutamate synthase